MARKVFGESLKSAMNKVDQQDEEQVAARTSPTVARAQASVIEEDKHATRLLDPGVIQMSAVTDRIDPSEGLEDLVASIREHGQKVPILVRKLDSGGFEIVYGRRRLLACKQAGVKIRATVMQMSDEEAIVAQGVENNARQDPSFIERALFISGVIKAGYSQAVAHRALGIDESLVSRMYKIANGIPDALIRAIGPAHGTGRRQWERLYKLCMKDPERASELAEGISQEKSGNQRIEEAISLMESTEDGLDNPFRNTPCLISRKGNRITIEVDPYIFARLEKDLEELLQQMSLRAQEISDADMVEGLDRGQDTEPDKPFIKNQ